LVARPSFLFAPSEGDLQHTFLHPHWLGVVLGLLGALCQSTVYVLIRKLGVSINPMVLVWYLGAVGTPMGVIGTVCDGGFIAPTSWQQGGYYIAIGVLSYVGQWCFNTGVQLEQASVGSLMRTLDVPLSFCWQLWLFHVTPLWTSWLGAALVVTCCVGLGLYNYYRQAGQSSAGAYATVNEQAPNEQAPAVELDSLPALVLGPDPSVNADSLATASRGVSNSVISNLSHSQPFDRAGLTPAVCSDSLSPKPVRLRVVNVTTSLTAGIGARSAEDRTTFQMHVEEYDDGDKSDYEVPIHEAMLDEEVQDAATQAGFSVLS
jgi:hypothetical protein